MLRFSYLLAFSAKGLEAIFSYKCRGLQAAALTLAALTLVPAGASASIPVPFYSAEDALQGVYAHHLPPLTDSFVKEAATLVQTTDDYCQSQRTSPATEDARQTHWRALQSQWQQTMVAWEALSTPAVGPVLSRRSQRQIDFWPTRPELIQKALAKAPQTLADMELVGTLAKGLPAMELLLAQARPSQALSDPAKGHSSLSSASCHYLTLLAQGIAQEGNELQAELSIWAGKDWEQIRATQPDVSNAAFTEWLNQWFGGLERLRWIQLEKPIKVIQTSGNALKGNPPAFARLSRTANLASWRAQWASLRAQAQLTPAQRLSPSRPGQALIPIEGLLLGNGHIELAQRWSLALDAVTQQINALPSQAPAPAADQRALLSLASALKAVSLLYQGDVASALNTSLGFSDADGD